MCALYLCVLCTYLAMHVCVVCTIVRYVPVCNCMLQLLILTPLHVVFIRKKSSKWAVNLGRPPSPSKVAAP